MGHHIMIVGIGPGSRKYILPAAIDAIQNARVLVGGKRAILLNDTEAKKINAIPGHVAFAVSPVS